MKNLVAAYPEAYYIHTTRSTKESVEMFARLLDKYKTMGLFSQFPGQVSERNRVTGRCMSECVNAWLDMSLGV